jgi:hypothetical protein
VLKAGIAAASIILSYASLAESQVMPSAPALAYADLADLALDTPVVAHVRIRDAARLKPDEAPGLAPGRSRFYVRADVVSLIRGAQGLPAQISYLVDLPNDARGRPPRLRRKDEVILFAARVPGRAAEVRLVAPDAQLPFDPTNADRLRSLLREAVQPGAAPRIVGIGKAFHVPGSLPGESETQIFLQTADQRPVSLNILRRPGETPRWAVALTEIVDDAAGPPRPNSLLWYRLACTLPPSLPVQSVADSSPAERAAIGADYRLVLGQLGRCARTRSRL